jgi:outer membrane biosynthesis protein TonB
MKKRVSSLEKNKLLFYVVVAISILNIIVFLNVQDWNSVIFFGLAGFIAYSFKLDNTVSLIIAIVASNIFRASKKIREGMETENEEPEEPELKDEDKENAPIVKPKITSKSEPMVVKKVEKTTSKVEPLNISLDKPKSKGDFQPTEAYTSTTGKNSSNSAASALSNDAASAISKGTLEGFQDTAKNLMDRQDQLHKLAKQLGPLMTQASKMMKQLPDGFLRDALKKKT